MKGALKNDDFDESCLAPKSDENGCICGLVDHADVNQGPPSKDEKSPVLSRGAKGVFPGTSGGAG